ncbi:MAG: UDP-N-acetylmuramate--L-alanine ligase [Patescibacteria group bacterium]
MPDRGHHLHFLGIGGHAMRGLAAACRELGYEVTGTDEGAYPPGSDWLDRRGLTWWWEAAPEHLRGVSTVVVSGHIPPEHPELAAALERKIPVVSFAELVGDLAKDSRRIVVAGTHGKTTTTSLLAWTFESSGRKPDYLVGIEPRNFDTSVRLSGSDLTVIEGDEYRSSLLDETSKFTHYRPDVLLLTSLEHDHPDFFPDLAAVQARFRELVTALPAADGRLVYWQGSEAVRAIAEEYAGERHSYGFEGAAWHPERPRYDREGIRYTLKHHDDTLGELRVPIYGEHNILNSVAAAAVALNEGVPFESVASAFASFKGASRRFERVSTLDAPVTVLDDYAHHPTEAKTTIGAAALHFPGRVIAVYQPHTYSRTEKLLKEYHAAFGGADRVFITAIESAREQGAEHTVSGADVAKGIGRQARYIEDRNELLEVVVREARPGDVVLSMSVGGGSDFAAELAERLPGT